MTIDYQKEVIDSLYDAAVVVGLTMGYAMLGKKAFGMTKPGAKMDVDDGVKMTVYVAAGMMTKDYMVKQGWIPSSIIPTNKFVQRCFTTLVSHQIKWQVYW